MEVVFIKTIENLLNVNNSTSNLLILTFFIMKVLATGFVDFNFSLNVRFFQHFNVRFNLVYLLTEIGNTIFRSFFFIFINYYSIS